jgi:hypothetical protein
VTLAEKRFDRLSKPVKAVPDLDGHGLLSQLALNRFRNKCYDEGRNDGDSWT